MVVLPEAPLSRSQCDVVAFSVRHCLLLSATPSRSQRDNIALYKTTLCIQFRNSMHTIKKMTRWKKQTTHKAMPQRGMTRIASHFNGWYMRDEEKRAFRYATEKACISRTYGTLFYYPHLFPAVETAGYHCPMPMASPRNLN